MEPLLSVASGWSGPLGPFTLKADGLPFDLTSLTVAITIRRSIDGVLLTPGGTLVVAPDQVANKGQVTYTPAATDFVWVAGGTDSQEHLVRFKVTDAALKVVYFPNGEAALVSVYA